MKGMDNSRSEGLREKSLWMTEAVIYPFTEQIYVEHLPTLALC